MMRQIYILTTCMFSIVLAACEPDKGTTTQDALQAGPTTDGIAINNLDYGNSVIPFPNNILFAGTTDGTLNIPLAGDASDGPTIALNALDGFSTVAPITTGFSGALDDATIPAGVRLYEVETTGGAVSNVLASLTFGVDYFATQSVSVDGSSTLVILPLKPLKPEKTYMPVITTTLKSADGSTASKSSSYAVTQGLNPLHDGTVSNSLSLSFAQAQALEPLRQATVAAETTLNGFDGTLSSEIILSWNFTIQSIGDVLTAVRSIAGTPATTITASTVDLDGPGALPAGITPGTAAKMFEGTIDVPYYLTASASVNDPTALGSFWVAANVSPLDPGDTEKNIIKINPTPAVTATVSIPMLITLPTAGTAAFPTVIFQHGITSDRTSLLGIADRLAAAGFASVAIDMPMHGVNSSSPFYSAGNERTFDLDLVTQDGSGATTAAAPDGVTDSSGVHFINLTNLRNTRDNNRQAVADLFAVTAAIGSMDLTTAGGAQNLDAANIYFLGHSLGAMVGTVFTALEPNVKDVVLAFGGGGLPKVLDGSASFGPTISAGLAANGIVKGTADYESFLGAAQTVVDSADPINYGATAAAGHNILFFEIVGGAGSPSDLVVPNSVPDANDTSGTVAAPLAGTNPLVGAASMNLTATSTNGDSGDLLVKFSAGHHSSLLTSSNTSGSTAVISSQEVFDEIQTQATSYFSSGTATVTITDTSVIAAP